MRVSEGLQMWNDRTWVMEADYVIGASHCWRMGMLELLCMISGWEKGNEHAGTDG